MNACPAPASGPLRAPPLSLYVHVPWCVKKCPYCDFNSHAQRGALPERDYVDALLADLDQDLPLAAGRRIETVFFGGGTPSLLSADTIGRILDGVAARLPLAPDAELTLEANPGTVEHDRFEGYRRAGINRVSFGVQSFDDGCLRRLGRIHGSAEAEAAVRQAQDAGIDDINLDLIYALPEQTAAMAEADAARAVALSPTHVSHYQLTLEPGTVFAARPPEGLPEDDAAWEIQERCRHLLAAAGFGQYEVSAYARAGRRCRHNLNYWRFGDYLGIGAGAHGKLTDSASGAILRRSKRRYPNDYLAHANGPQRIDSETVIAPAQRPFEFMLNALRLQDGFERALFEAHAGLPFAAIAARIGALAARGWLEDDGRRVRATPLGQRFLNDVLLAFLDD